MLSAEEEKRIADESLLSPSKNLHAHMIIAMTGLKGSGKTAIAQYIEKKGFARITPPEVGAESASWFQTLSPDMNYVVDTIAEPERIDLLKQKDDVVVVRVESPAELRLERLIEQKKQVEEKEYSYDEVLEFEKIILDDEEALKQQLVLIVKTTNVIIRNDNTLEMLYKKVDQMMADLAKKFTFKKPSDDAFFMEIAQLIAKKSRCSKRKVGAALVKNKRILAMGFDDTPRRILHCNENGCPACNDLTNPSLHACLCSHAEENAIIQAAYHGVSAQDAILYTTESPCLACTKIIINAGIKEIIFNQEHALTEMAYALLQQAEINVKPKKFP